MYYLVFSIQLLSSWPAQVNPCIEITPRVVSRDTTLGSAVTRLVSVTWKHVAQQCQPIWSTNPMESEHLLSSSRKLTCSLIVAGLHVLYVVISSRIRHAHFESCQKHGIQHLAILSNLRMVAVPSVLLLWMHYSSIYRSIFSVAILSEYPHDQRRNRTPFSKFSFKLGLL